METYEPIEKFREREGMTPSLDTHDTGVHQYVLLNFDRGEELGGYISIKLDDEGVIVDVINKGDVLGSMWIPYPDLSPDYEEI